MRWDVARAQWSCNIDVRVLWCVGWKGQTRPLAITEIRTLFMVGELIMLFCTYSFLSGIGVSVEVLYGKLSCFWRMLFFLLDAGGTKF